MRSPGHEIISPVKKIPTLFRRDRDDMRRLIRAVYPECQWVLDGEGVATRKYDGICVMRDAEGWWARRQVKTDKEAPDRFRPVESDPTTGTMVGWEPIEQAPFVKYVREALNQSPQLPPVGTYELCGPKINGNPESFGQHILIPHDTAEEVKDAPRDFDGLAAFLAGFPYEGIVWHHPDGRMAKIKRRDFPRS